MSQRFFIYFVIISFISCTFLSCSDVTYRNHGPSDVVIPSPDSEWTVLYYGAGNSMEDVMEDGRSKAVSAVQAMEQVFPSESVHALACISSEQTGGICRIYEVTFHPEDIGTTISSRLFGDLGAADMSDPATLQAFLELGLTNFPANNFALILSGEGCGWKGTFNDAINGSNQPMMLTELHSTLSAVQPLLPNGRFQIINWYAPSMSSIEVVYELSAVAERMVARPWHWKADFPPEIEIWYRDLCADSDMNTDMLCQRMIDAALQSAEYYETSTRDVLLDLTKADETAVALEIFASALRDPTTNNPDMIQMIRDSSWVAATDDSDHVDLSKFIDGILASELVTNFPNLAEAASALQSEIDGIVTDDIIASADDEREGLTIYFPATMDSLELNSYNSITLSQSKPSWKECLEDLAENVGSQITVTGTVTWPGNPIQNIRLFLNTAQFGAPQIHLTVPVTLTPLSTPDSAHFQISFSLGSDSLEAYVGLFSDRDLSGTLSTNDRLGYIRTPPALRDWITLYPGTSIDNVAIVLGFNF